MIFPLYSSRHQNTLLFGWREVLRPTKDVLFKHATPHSDFTLFPPSHRSFFSVATALLVVSRRIEQYERFFSLFKLSSFRIFICFFVESSEQLSSLQLSTTKTRPTTTMWMWWNPKSFNSFENSVELYVFGRSHCEKLFEKIFAWDHHKNKPMLKLPELSVVLRLLTSKKWRKIQLYEFHVFFVEYVRSHCRFIKKQIQSSIEHRAHFEVKRENFPEFSSINWRTQIHQRRDRMRVQLLHETRHRSFWIKIHENQSRRIVISNIISHLDRYRLSLYEHFLSLWIRTNERRTSPRMPHTTLVYTCYRNATPKQTKQEKQTNNFEQWKFQSCDVSREFLARVVDGRARNNEISTVQKPTDFEKGNNNTHWSIIV